MTDSNSKSTSTSSTQDSILQLDENYIPVDGKKRELWDIDKLSHWGENPRSIATTALKQLQARIKALGQFKPLLVLNDGTVAGGNQRLTAYLELGIKKVWVSVLPVDPSDKQKVVEYALTDNERFGEYDEEALAKLIASLPKFNIDDYKIDLGKLTTLSELVDKYAATPDEDDIPEVGEGPAKAKIGDIYQLGPHRLMCGDATNPEHVKQLMEGSVADMVFTDPPYNVAYTGGPGSERKAILNDKMPTEQFYNFLYDVMHNLMDVCRGAFYVCMSPHEIGTLKLAFENAGGHWQSTVIWAKNTFTLSGADWQNQYEPILYGWNKANKNHYFAGFRDEGNVWRNLEAMKTKFEDGKTIIDVGPFIVELEGKVQGKVLKKRDKVDLWEVKKPTKSAEHPTMKPVKLVSKAVRASSKRGDLVLDVFGGSGSTLIAAEKTNRICYTMELEPLYIDVIIERWENLTQQNAVKLN